MSNPETFIDEVTEEVRRDQLFALFRKWGWVGVVAVIAIVGGASANEVLKARAERQAQETGDAILAAMEAADPAARIAALEAVPAEGDARAVLALIEAAEAEEPAAADAILAGIAEGSGYPALYRDLATVKRVMLPRGTMSASDRIAALEPIVAAGGPFRVLAEEQLALAEIEAGDAGAALARLEALMQDAEAGDALRDRASQLIVALGGTLD